MKNKPRGPGFVHLILGGARSGKSSFALQWCDQRAEQMGLTRRFIATATAMDEEMARRIARHQAERDAGWQLNEVPLALTETLQQAAAGELILVDCLTLWLNNRLYESPDDDHEQSFQRLARVLQQCPAEVVLIANEVGLGVIPMGEISRRFVDHAGWLNQAMAKVADRVTFVSAGLPMTLKQ